ncbi:MAG: hypothetical protein KJ621_17760, partial [Proteobacteria bacterium]|nr:hypothetical protein [Pseudomonadota bacterium]MBU1742816.1 hypothetical protein [Pseudomonadota bacterium]
MTAQPPPIVEQLHRLRVNAAAASTRLDVFAASRLPQLSRTRLQRLIEAGLVNVDGRLVRASYQVKPGETIEVLVGPAEPTDLVAEPIPLKVVFEDDHL